jgi:hypothetical protein
MRSRSSSRCSVADHTSTLTTLGNFSVYLIGQGTGSRRPSPSAARRSSAARASMGPDHASTLIANNVMGLVYIRQKKLRRG